ncbi:MAG: biopolymer transporter ExbD [Candidatus Latescibacterota bacterium]|nr:MAG: biopolymer transporter ExbD [Candidatus Latescibacterota bacterium]
MKKSPYSSLSEINITSLVDVMMVLLIIFMLTAPFIQAGIKVRLPKAKSTVIKETEGLILAISKEGDVYINNDKVEMDQLAESLRNLKVAGEERVFVRADQDVPYGVVMNVVGNVKEVGIDEVGMITELETIK